MRFPGEVLDAAIKVHTALGPGLLESVIIEIKAANALIPIHEAQLLSYLRLSGRKVGPLLNFHVLRMRDGIKRMVNGL